MSFLIQFDERDFDKAYEEEITNVNEQLEKEILFAMIGDVNSGKSSTINRLMGDEAIAESKQNIKEEIADILIYLVQLADKLKVNLEEEATSKLVKNAINYPLNKSGGKVK